MCPNTILYNLKAMGSEWSVLYLAIATLYSFVNYVHAEHSVLNETFSNVSDLCPHLDKNQQHIFIGHPSGYFFGFLDNKDNSSFTEQGPRKSTSGFSISHGSLIVTLVVGLVLVLSCVSYNLYESNKVVRLLTKKVVDLNCSNWKMSFAYHNLVDEYDTTKAELEKALIKIRTLEEQLQVKSQAVSEVEGLLNDSMLMATDELDKVKRREATVHAKYRIYKDKLKTAYSESDKLSEEIETLEIRNEGLEEQIGELLAEVMDYREYFPYEGKRRRVLENLNQVNLLDPIPEQSSVPSNSESSPDPGSSIGIQGSPIPKKKRKNIFRRTWSRVFSRKPKKSTTSESESAKVHDARMTLPSDLAERVGSKPP